MIVSNILQLLLLYSDERIRPQKYTLCMCRVEFPLECGFVDSDIFMWTEFQATTWFLLKLMSTWCMFTLHLRLWCLEWGHTLSSLLLAHLKSEKGALSWVTIKWIPVMMAQNGCLFTEINITITIRGPYIFFTYKHEERKKINYQVTHKSILHKLTSSFMLVLSSNLILVIFKSSYAISASIGFMDFFVLKKCVMVVWLNWQNIQ